MCVRQTIPQDRGGILAIRSRLCRAQVFESVIRDVAPDCRVTARACGIATPEETAGAIRVAESGTLYVVGTRREFATSNVYCWQFGEDWLTLGHGHGRGSAGRITALAVFRPPADGSSEWAGESPHHCGRDRYYARVGLTSEGVELHWHVFGPHKHYTISTQYSDRPC